MGGYLPLQGQCPDWIFCFVLLTKYLNRASILTGSVHLSLFANKIFKVLQKLQVFASSPSTQAKPFACSTDKTSLRSICVGGRDRTSDPRLMSPVLYRLSYADDR